MTVRHHTHADAIEAATRGLVARLAAQAEELAELRQRDRVISHQLDQRAGGRDAFTQALLAELDAEKDKVKAQAERIAALEGALAMAALNVRVMRALPQFNNAEALEVLEQDLTLAGKAGQS
jgi:hypothetical protein